MLSISKKDWSRKMKEEELGGRRHQRRTPLEVAAKTSFGPLLNHYFLKGCQPVKLLVLLYAGRKNFNFFNKS